MNLRRYTLALLVLSSAAGATLAASRAPGAGAEAERVQDAAVHDYFLSRWCRGVPGAGPLPDICQRYFLPR